MDAIISKALPSGRIYLERYGNLRSQVDYWTVNPDKAHRFASAGLAVDIAAALEIGQADVFEVGFVAST